MNERIRLLAEQAYEQKPLMVLNPETYEPEHKIGNGGVPMYNRVFNQEKFAELIVRECAELCDRFQARGVGMQPAECAGAIRKMFGVEE
jgi:hypothetical protein